MVEEVDIATIQWLEGYDEGFMLEFLTTALNHLLRKVNAKTFEFAAEKLGMEDSDLVAAAEELGHILIDCATQQFGQERVAELQIPHAARIAEFYAQRYIQLREMTSDFSLHRPLNGTYLDFKWRLDVQMASRISSEVVKPKYIINLETNDGSHMVESNYATLEYIHDELQQAQKSITGSKAKKAERIIK